MGGMDIATNLVKLTAKEHYVAHHLLYKIYRNKEMTMAFMLMVNVERGGQKFKITASTYHKLKEDNAEVRSIAMTGGVSPAKGKKWSKESKAKLSASTKGRTGGNYNTPGFRGKHHTEENKKAISERRKGIGTHFTPHSEETRKKMSEDRKGKTKVPWTEERKAARALAMKEIWNKRKSPD